MEKYLEYFYDIASIPHGSGNTKKISDYLVCFAKENNLEYHQDKNDNVIICKEASAGYEDKEGIILQGHIDMVTVKTADCDKDLMTEGLDLIIENNVLSAKNTSLGGDDGIAVAYMLTLLSGDYKTPRLECIFTTDEEIGLLGADSIDVSDITSKRMINLDQEEEGIFVAGCAGGIRIDSEFEVNKKVLNGYVYEITVSNLKGGHSGVDINKNRGNAICIMGRELHKLLEKVSFNLIEINGGVADNAIPNFVKATIIIDENNYNPILEKQIMMLNGMDISFGDEINNDMAIFEVKAQDLDSMIALDTESTARVLSFINDIPYGVMAMSEADPTMVETSLNPGIILSEEERIIVSTSIRSSMDIEKQSLINKIIKLTFDKGGAASTRGDYPGWAYNPFSELVNKMSLIYEDMFGNKPKIVSIHAGLECGLFCKKIQGLSCISIGPDILDIHSVNERLPLDSAKRCFDYLVKCLEVI